MNPHPPNARPPTASHCVEEKVRNNYWNGEEERKAAFRDEEWCSEKRILALPQGRDLKQGTRRGSDFPHQKAMEPSVFAFLWHLLFPSRYLWLRYELKGHANSRRPATG
jgi:hypothetical protein